VRRRQGRLDGAAGGVQAEDVSSVDPCDPVGLMLDGLGQGVDLADLHRSIRECFLSDRTLSPRLLLELAASAFVACRVSRDDPLELDGLDRKLYPEWPAHGNTAHQKRRYALQAAILIAVGVEPEDA
jgi:hypothetical protein